MVAKETMTDEIKVPKPKSSLEDTDSKESMTSDVGTVITLEEDDNEPPSLVLEQQYDHTQPEPINISVETGPDEGKTQPGEERPDMDSMKSDRHKTDIQEIYTSQTKRNKRKKKVDSRKETPMSINQEQQESEKDRVYIEGDRATPCERDDFVNIATWDQEQNETSKMINISTEPQSLLLSPLRPTEEDPKFKGPRKLILVRKKNNINQSQSRVTLNTTQSDRNMNVSAVPKSGMRTLIKAAMKRN